MDLTSIAFGLVTSLFIFLLLDFFYIPWRIGQGASELEILMVLILMGLCILSILRLLIFLINYLDNKKPMPKPVPGKIRAEEAEAKKKKVKEEKRNEGKKEEEQRLEKLERERNAAQNKRSLELLERRVERRELRVVASGWILERQERILESLERRLDRTERELERIYWMERLHGMERMLERMKEENAALREAQRKLEAPQERGRGWMWDLRPRVSGTESTSWWGTHEGPAGRETPSFRAGVDEVVGEA